MYQQILKILINSYFGKKLTNLGYLPRWIVFSIDFIIVLFSSLITFSIVNSLTVTFYNSFNVFYRIGIILFINSFFFIIFKTYSGIIRYSTFIDGLKLLISTTCSYFLLVLLNYVYFFYTNQKIYLTSSLFIGYVISFLFLFLLRILVKYLFENLQYIVNNDDSLNTVIYGSNAYAISVANVLKSENSSGHKLVGFIDKLESSNSFKKILNLPILNHNMPINLILKSLDSNSLIIADKNLTKQERIAIVEECIEFNIKVFTVPLIENWEDKSQISKKATNFQIEDLLERKPIVLDTNSISDQLNGKTILIIGAAGSIGSEITRQVFSFNPKRILILDQAETPLHNLKLQLANLNANLIVNDILADIRDFDSLETVFKTYNPDIVYHAAAYKHVPIIEENPIQAVYTNIIGTKNLSDLSQKYNVNTFVMVSTDKAVNPSNVMGASKRIAEKYIQSLHYKIKNEKFDNCTKFITTRFGNVLGSNGSIVPLFTQQILDGGPVTITHPEISRYFMTISEACQLVLEAGTIGNGGEIFIFNMGKPVKIIDLANKMIRLAGFIPNKDIKIKIIGLRPGEKLCEELLTDSSRTLFTHNEKILITTDVFEDFDKLNNCIINLNINANKLSNLQIVALMKKIVPEFISKNSVYEELDN